MAALGAVTLLVRIVIMNLMLIAESRGNDASRPQSKGGEICQLSQNEDGRAEPEGRQATCRPAPGSTHDSTQTASLQPLLPPLQDRPMQLVRPDPSHKKMEIVEESIQPTTMTLSSGIDVSVIFLDTEGFAANNVSETYDAKVFAVAALLSSFLIYNSVKVIDQADLDYLELLSRRTQLFALRSQLSRAKWAQDFNHDLLSFPPLLWVVQDFVQVTGNDEPTPLEWLTEMMKSSAWESENHRVSLLDIFQDVDCHTLFFPATKKEILQDLSLAREEDLTAEYKVERNRLINILRQGIIPKEKNGRPITGAELASLIEVLVTAANEGSLSQIPSRWSAFIQSMEQSAVQDCLKFYDTEMVVLHQQYEMGPIDETELQLWHETAASKTDKLLQQVLFGLDDVLTGATQELRGQIREKYHRTMDMNEKKIKLRCSEVQHRTELDGESRLSELPLPVRTSELKTSYAKIKEDCIGSYTRTLDRLQRSMPFQKFLDQLKTSLDNIRDSFLLKNTQLLENVLDQSTQRALEEFNSLMQNPHQEPRSPKTMTRCSEDAAQKALSLFVQEAVVAAEEASYKAHQALLKTGIVEAEKEHEKRNNLLLKVRCEKEVNGLAQTMRDNTDSTQLPLPVNDTDLDHRLTQEATRAKSLFKELLDDFSSLPAYDDCLMQLQRLIHAVCGQRRQENMEAYSKEVEVPLQSAKKVALLSADRYDTVFSLTTFIREVCMLNLDEGKPKHWPADLKVNIVDLFMNSDPDIRRVIKAREGLWSTVVGFVQWIIWIFS
ncbi:uncharacterized protein LOC110975829 isoform X2 [Acanthaster planci]|uniref:Uncharacterized protein LOC110975829 isoform X2 n=1 Tax=Acanthaster planci TaxID=133434 RepID=A0A8B7XWC7_ACAPL|nr:uncharacterized protein LOC110975829 isoform X2 [Acanthaster planci]